MEKDSKNDQYLVKFNESQFDGENNNIHNSSHPTEDTPIKMPIDMFDTNKLLINKSTSSNNPDNNNTLNCKRMITKHFVTYEIQSAQESDGPSSSDNEGCLPDTLRSYDMNKQATSPNEWFDNNNDRKLFLQTQDSQRFVPTVKSSSQKTGRTTKTRRNSQNFIYINTLVVNINSETTKQTKKSSFKRIQTQTRQKVTPSKRTFGDMSAKHIKLKPSKSNKLNKTAISGKDSYLNKVNNIDEKTMSSANIKNVKKNNNLTESLSGKSSKIVYKKNSLLGKKFFDPESGSTSSIKFNQKTNKLLKRTPTANNQKEALRSNPSKIEDNKSTITTKRSVTPTTPKSVISSNQKIGITSKQQQRIFSEVSQKANSNARSHGRSSKHCKTKCLSLNCKIAREVIKSRSRSVDQNSSANSTGSTNKKVLSRNNTTSNCNNRNNFWTSSKVSLSNNSNNSQQEFSLSSNKAYKLNRNVVYTPTSKNNTLNSKTPLLVRKNYVLNNENSSNKVDNDSSKKFNFKSYKRAQTDNLKIFKVQDDSKNDQDKQIFKNKITSLGSNSDSKGKKCA